MLQPQYMRAGVLVENGIESEEERVIETIESLQ
jgi:hypothetical protein